MHLVTHTEIEKSRAQEEVQFPEAPVQAPAAKSSSLDVVSQMRANLNQLEDLHGRLSYVMGEVRHVIKKSTSRS